MYASPDGQVIVGHAECPDACDAECVVHPRSEVLYMWYKRIWYTVSHEVSMTVCHVIMIVTLP